MELRPGSSSTLQRYAVFLSSQGRYEEGLPLARRAVEIDPLSANAYRTLGLVHFQGRDLPRAIDAEQRSLELDGTSVAGRMMLAWSLIAAGRSQEAFPDLEPAFQNGNRELLLAIQGQAFARAGQRDKAVAIRTELLSHSPPSTGALVRVNAGLCDGDAAFASLDKAVDERLDFITWLKVDPLFDCLRADSRFNPLLQRVGLSQKR